MKRAFYEWSALGSLFLSVACIACWGVSIGSEETNLELAFGKRSVVQMFANDGSVTLCDHIENLEVIEKVIQSPNSFNPAPTVVYGWRLPGIEFNLIKFADGWNNWSLRLSLLIPFAVLLVFGVFCVRQYRLIRRLRLIGDDESVN
jgi:hypothetical protein